MDFLVATCPILILVLLSWVYGRVLSGGSRLNPFKRRLLIYASVFATGMIYLMLIVSDLHWPKELIFPLIGPLGSRGRSCRLVPVSVLLYVRL